MGFVWTGETFHEVLLLRIYSWKTCVHVVVNYAGTMHAREVLDYADTMLATYSSAVIDYADTG